MKMHEYRLDTYDVMLVGTEDEVLRFRQYVAALKAACGRAEEVAMALETLGAETPSNMSTPQIDRDMYRHQAYRLRQALADIPDSA